MRHADQHAGKIVDEGDGLIDQPDRGQQFVENAILLQDDDPRGRAHERARPERQQHDDQQDLA